MLDLLFEILDDVEVWCSQVEALQTCGNRGGLEAEFNKGEIGDLNEIVTFLLLESEPSILSLCGLDSKYFRP